MERDKYQKLTYQQLEFIKAFIDNSLMTSRQLSMKYNI